MAEEKAFRYSLWLDEKLDKLFKEFEFKLYRILHETLEKEGWDLIDDYLEQTQNYFDNHFNNMIHRMVYDLRSIKELHQNAKYRSLRKNINVEEIARKAGASINEVLEVLKEEIWRQ